MTLAPAWPELFARRTLGIRLELQTVLAAYDALGRPAAGTKAIHIVGTNGKGSTAAMCDHALRRAGRRVGLFTSPHLHRVGERVRLDGAADDDDVLGAAVARVLALEQRLTLPRPLSFFELLTLAAWLRFADAGVDVIVAEAGMGGRLDATRLCDAAVVAVASIDLDHRQFLGDTVAAIAAEKIAVARAGVPVVSVAQAPQAAAVIAAHCRELGAPLRWVEPLPHSPQGLAGAHQRHNAALALAAVRVLQPACDADALDGVQWPGRLERLPWHGGTLLLDVGHNPAGIASLLASLRDDPALPRTRVFVGTMADKDHVAIAAAVAALGRPWTWVDLTALGSAGVAAPGGVAGVADRDVLLQAVIEALQRGEQVCVCGSHVLVAAVRAAALGLPRAQPGER
ncbi:MAG: bifunctional folylpolyglutamate synthase/dihydrofolate synthase [Nannocystaceae bacterium]|nr:bifunctional folylpolyglutamate synthase/dihydrofolate synthase [Nannocystaceae bacterium]